MKTMCRRTVGALFGLGVLWVLVPAARSDDATDWANQLAQAQREREEWQNQLAQAQKEREDRQAQLDQAQRDRDQQARDQQAREDWQNQLFQAQKEREDSMNQLFQAQRDREQAQKEREDWQNQLWQAQRERDEYLNQLTQDNMKYMEDLRKFADEQNQSRQAATDREPPWAPELAGPAAVPRAAPALAALTPQPGAGQLPTHTLTIHNGPQVTRAAFVLRDGSWQAGGGPGTDAVRPPAPMPFDPVAFQQAVRRQVQQTQLRVRQRIGR